MHNQKIGLGVLRYGFVFVFLWFASQQLLHTEMWTRLIPAWVVSMSGMSAGTIVIINAVFECIGALLLAFNIFTPIVSVLLSLHLLSIAFDLGVNINFPWFSAIGVRDIGLATSILALAFLSSKKS